MNKTARLQMRLDAEKEARFSAAADRLNMSRSQIIRDLLRAAADYIEQYGRWYPPKLVPDIPAEVAPRGVYPSIAGTGRALRAAERPAPAMARALSATDRKARR
jgi:hypothetical protein